jgi:hypothetical protein
VWGKDCAGTPNVLRPCALGCVRCMTLPVSRYPYYTRSCSLTGQQSHIVRLTTTMLPLLPLCRSPSSIPFCSQTGRCVLDAWSAPCRTSIMLALPPHVRMQVSFFDPSCSQTGKCVLDAWSAPTSTHQPQSMSRLRLSLHLSLCRCPFDPLLQSDREALLWCVVDLHHVATPSLYSYAGVFL